MHTCLREFVLDVFRVEQAGKFAVQAFIARDQFVGKRQAGHQTAFFEPENRAERAGKENAFHGGKRHQPLHKVFAVDPAQSPFALFLHARHRIQRIEQVVLFLRVFHIRVNQQRICFRVDVFHHDLEAVKAFGFGILHFGQEIHAQVFVHNAIAGRKKRQNVLDEVPFAVVQFLPVRQVGRKVNFLGSPKAGFGLLVHLPDVVVFNREQHEAVRVFGQQWLVGGNGGAMHIFWMFRML